MKSQNIYNYKVKIGKQWIKHSTQPPGSIEIRNVFNLMRRKVEFNKFGGERGFASHDASAIASENRLGSNFFLQQHENNTIFYSFQHFFLLPCHISSQVINIKFQSLNKKTSFECLYLHGQHCFMVRSRVSWLVMVKSCAKRDCATIKSDFQLDDRLAQKNTRKAARLKRRKTGSCRPVFVQKTLSECVQGKDS